MDTSFVTIGGKNHSGVDTMFTMIATRSTIMSMVRDTDIQSSNFKWL